MRSRDRLGDAKSGAVGEVEGGSKTYSMFLRICETRLPTRRVKALRRAGLRIRLRSLGSVAIGGMVADCVKSWGVGEVECVEIEKLGVPISLEDIWELMRPSCRWRLCILICCTLN